MTDLEPHAAPPPEPTSREAMPRAWVLHGFWDVLFAIIPFLLMVIFITIGIYKAKCVG